MDLQLLARAKSGNIHALTELMQTNYIPVYKYLLKLTLDSHEAEDLTQEVMMKTLEKLNHYDPLQAELSTWMITIGRNCWIDRLRKVQRHPMDTLEYLAPQEVAIDPIESLLQTDALSQSLKKLKPIYRVPIVLYYYGAHSYSEIAQILNIPLGTVKSRINTGIGSLRKEISINE